MYDESQAAADSARKWVIWSVVIWFICVVIVIVFGVVGAFNAGDSNAAMPGVRAAAFGCAADGGRVHHVGVRGHLGG